MAGGKVRLGLLFQIAAHCSREAMAADTGGSQAQCSPIPDGKINAGAQVTSLSLLLQSGTTTHGAGLSFSAKPLWKYPRLTDISGDGVS